MVTRARVRSSLETALLLRSMSSAAMVPSSPSTEGSVFDISFWTSLVSAAAFLFSLLASIAFLRFCFSEMAFKQQEAQTDELEVPLLAGSEASGGGAAGVLRWALLSTIFWEALTSAAATANWLLFPEAAAFIPAVLSAASFCCMLACAMIVSAGKTTTSLAFWIWLVPFSVAMAIPSPLFTALRRFADPVLPPWISATLPAVGAVFSLVVRLVRGENFPRGSWAFTAHSVFAATSALLRLVLTILYCSSAGPWYKSSDLYAGVLPLLCSVYAFVCIVCEGKHFVVFLRL